MTDTVFLGFSPAWIALCLDMIEDAVKPTCILNVPCDLEHPVAERIRFTAADQWEFAATDRLALGVGRSASRRAVLSAFSNLIHPDSSFHNIVSGNASISETVVLGQGVVVSPQCVIAAYSSVGDHSVLNRASTVGHDTELGRFVAINPGAHVAGNCRVGDDVTIGMGAVVFDHVKVGNGSVIGGGSVVTSDVPEGVVVLGSPAKPIRSVDDKRQNPIRGT